MTVEWEMGGVLFRFQFWLKVLVFRGKLVGADLVKIRKNIATLANSFYAVQKSMMKKVVVASTNPVKISATFKAFAAMFPEENFEVEGVDVPSEVSEQPLSDEETFAGAYTRAYNAVAEVPFATYWVGIEGGIAKHNDEMETFAWVVVLDENAIGKARTAGFFLPESVRRLIEQGMELGEADDIVFGTSDSKKTLGASGLLTRGMIDRTQLYFPAIALALVPFMNPLLYPFNERSE